MWKLREGLLTALIAAHRWRRCWARTAPRCWRTGTTPGLSRKSSSGSRSGSTSSLCLNKWRLQQQGTWLQSSMWQTLLIILVSSKTTNINAVANQHSNIKLKHLINYFRGMFKSVVAALNEALDITLHLQPLRAHFKASNIMLDSQFLMCLYSDVRNHRVYGRQTTVPSASTYYLFAVLK